MKNAIAIAVATALSFTVSATASAAGYSTNFNDLLTNQSLSGQDGWETNDPYNDAGTPSDFSDDFGQADSVEEIAPGDNIARLGGIYFPGNPVTHVSHAFDLSSSDLIAFNTLLLITPSSDGLAQDTFGWTFQTTSGSDVFSLRFTPSGSTFLTADWFNSSGVEQANSLDVVNIQYGTYYQLAININKSTNQFNAFISAEDGSGTEPVVINGDLGSQSLGANDIGRLAATWILANPSTPGTQQANAGDNSMVFDNVSVVPEPSAIALLGLGCASLLFRRRR
jgi:hypothetical protein